MSSSDPLIGKKLGDYSIQGILGTGGMARVYRGYDDRLNRYSAVKVIEPQLIASAEEDEYRERFLREARAIAQLRHPRIVGIYQFGQLENLYYIAMEYVEGRNLREVLKTYSKQSQLMPVKEVLQILTDIGDALDYAHRQNIIHRDVKPSNIIVTDSTNGVLTDFGLALNAIEGTIGNTFGSVHYIAPEQAISSAQAVPQSDQYSLAIVAFEMLTGRVPFDDASAMSVALKHISDAPPSLTDINPVVPPSVERVALKALDKDYTKRYASCKAFVNALDDAFKDVDLGTAGTATNKRVIAPIPAPMPTHEVDSPTVSESRRAFMDMKVAQQKGEIPPPVVGGRNGVVVIGAIIALLLVAIIFLLLQSNANNANATSTAVALVAQNAQNETATVVFNAGLTATNDALSTQTSQAMVASNMTVEAAISATALSEQSTTQTAQAVVASNMTVEAAISATALSEQSATQTAQAIPTLTNTTEPTQQPSATNADVSTVAPSLTAETVTLEPTHTAQPNTLVPSDTPQPTTAVPTKKPTDQPTDTSANVLAVTAESTSEAVATVTDIPTTAPTHTPVPPTATDTATFTSTPKPTNTSTPTQTHTSTHTPTVTHTPTATRTPTNTPTPTVTSTPDLVISDGEKQTAMLRYDGRTVVLVNLGANPLKVQELQFVLFEPDPKDATKFVETQTFVVTTWNNDFWQASQGLPFDTCLQLWTRDYSDLRAESISDSCKSFKSFRQTAQTFWVSAVEGAYFEVKQGKVDVIATCQANKRDTLDEQRCAFEVK